MLALTALWLPILLSAILVFVARSIMHRLLPYHRGDCQRLPYEDNLLAVLGAAGLKPGLYLFPFATVQEMKAPALMEKYRQGPVGTMTVLPSGPPVRSTFLGMWFVYFLIIGFFVAYLARYTLPPGASYLVVFRVVGTAAFLAYGLGHLSNGIGKGQAWSTTVKEVFDGLVYGLLTASTFGWLWPR